MDFQPAVRTFDFPPRLDQAEIENRCARESFTWGPQALWLLCGLVWLFYFLVRDLPGLARNILPFAAGATLLAALAVRYELRRRRRQTVLYALGGGRLGGGPVGGGLGGGLGGRIGCYQGNVVQNQYIFQYQYSFGREEMIRVQADFFGQLMIVLKLLVPMALLVVIVAVLLIDGLKAALTQSGPAPAWPDMAVFVYALLFAVFGLVASYRSHFRLVFFWIPNGKGKTNKALYLHPGELRKIEGGDAPAIG